MAVEFKLGQRVITSRCRTLRFFRPCHATVMTWQERCAQLQALSIDPVVTSLLGDLDEDLGALVDRATALLVSNGLIGVSTSFSALCAAQIVDRQRQRAPGATRRTRTSS